MTQALQVNGLAQLQAKLSQLSQELQESIVLGGLRAGANVVAEEARRLAPSGPPSTTGRKHGISVGSLRNDIRITQGSVSKGVATVRVRVGGKGRQPYYARFVELGTAAHWIYVAMTERPGRMTRRGYRPWSMRTINKAAKRGSLKIGQNFVGQSIEHPGARPRPFMRPALDNKAQEAIDAIAKYINARLARIAGGLKAAA